MGGSFSSASNWVQVNNTISQQFAGVCDFNCNNSINGANIDFIGVHLTGGVNINQACSVDGTCSVNSSLDGVIDTVAKASSSSNAKNAYEFFDIGNIDQSESSSLVQISNTLQQSVYEKCKVQSYNDISNLDVFAANSTITGGININQTGNVVGNCALTNFMQAAENTSVTSTSNSTSGKDKKGELCGSKSGLGAIAAWVGLGIVVVVFLVIAAWAVSKFVLDKQSPLKPGTAASEGKPTASRPSLASRLEAEF